MVAKDGHYTVRQLADLAGVTARTLHHYDRIGLLKPAERTRAGYRLYAHAELLRLQQILFFRELDVPLATIKEFLDAPDFNPVEALEEHRRLLQEHMKRLERLLATLDRTLGQYKEQIMLSDEELYEGFQADDVERVRMEAKARYGGDVIEQSETKLRKLSREAWTQVQEEGGYIAFRLAALMDQDPTGGDVQEAVAAHHAWIENFYPCSAERYRGLAKLYVEHDEFRAFYERYGEGLAVFMQAAMLYYADQNLEDVES